LFGKWLLFHVASKKTSPKPEELKKILIFAIPTLKRVCLKRFSVDFEIIAKVAQSRLKRRD
jgi:hypothetical protein